MKPPRGIRLDREQVSDIMKALNGINSIVKQMDAKAHHPSWRYGIMSNLTAIQMIVTGIPKVTPN